MFIHPSFTTVAYIFSLLKNQRSLSVATISMHFLALIKIISGWHGSNGVIPTCPGINQNFGLVTSLKAGKCHYLPNNYQNKSLIVFRYFMNKSTTLSLPNILHNLAIYQEDIHGYQHDA